MTHGWLQQCMRSRGEPKFLTFNGADFKRYDVEVLHPDVVRCELGGVPMFHPPPRHPLRPARPTRPDGRRHRHSAARLSHRRADRRQHASSWGWIRSSSPIAAISWCSRARRSPAAAAGADGRRLYGGDHLAGRDGRLLDPATGGRRASGRCIRRPPLHGGAWGGSFWPSARRRRGRPALQTGGTGRHHGGRAALCTACGYRVIEKLVENAPAALPVPLLRMGKDLTQMAP